MNLYFIVHIAVSYTHLVMETTGYNADQPMKIEVKVSGDTVKSVKVLEAPGETEYYGSEIVHGTEVATEKGKAFHDKYLTCLLYTSKYYLLLDKMG